MTNKVLTVPNILTLIRLILVPIFVIIFLYGYEMTALIIFLIAASTDVVDGYIARKFNLISNLGKVLDPLADKALRLAATIVFVIINVLPVWVLAVMLSFDLMLIFASTILYKKSYVVSSNVFGKTAGFVSIFAITLCFFYETVAPMHLIFTYISLVLIFVSIVVYTGKVVKNLTNKNSFNE